MPRAERVNVQRTLAFVGFFYFIFSAGKACLFPYLTIYFRYLGLSATQTGIILGLKPFAALLATPFWIHCAIRHNKRRVILMTAILTMIGANLGLTLIPPFNQEAANESCQGTNSKLTNKTDGQNYAIKPFITKIEHIVFHGNSQESATTPDLSSQPAPPADLESSVNTSTKANIGPQSTQRDLSDSDVVTVPDALTTRNVKSTMSKVKSSQGPNEQDNNDFTGAENKSHHSDSNDETTKEHDNDDIPHEDPSSENLDSLSSDDYQKAVKYLGKLLGEMKDGDTDTGNRETLPEEHQKHNSKRQAEMEFDLNKTQFSDGTNHSTKSLDTNGAKMLKDETKQQVEYITYMTVLVIVILGEILASPADKICDDALYETLDHIDEVDKYGRHHFVSLIGMAIGAVAVGIGVHFAHCEIFLDANRIMIHFYAFAGLCGISFLLAFCYPMQDTGKTLKYDKLFRGLVILLTDCNNIMVVITLLLIGFISASIQNFMFWAILELEGSEIVMGLTVAVSAVAEMPTLFASGVMTKRIGHMGVMGLASLALSARLLYFSYLWNPWAAIPIEILNMFCKGALWESAMLYAEHTAPPGMQRTVQVVMVVLYYGIGSSNGSAISGIIYEQYGRRTMFLCFSIVALFWAAVLVIYAKFVPKRRKLHYSKILRDEEDNNNDDDDIFDSSDEGDDWLVNALRKDKF